MVALTKEQKYMLGGAAAAALFGIYTMKKTITEQDPAKLKQAQDNNKKMGTAAIIVGVAIAGYVVYKTQCGGAASSSAPASDFGALDSGIFKE
jgi:hypothetical protein